MTGLMGTRLGAVLAAIIVMTAGLAEAQMPSNVMLNYQDPSQRTSRRSERDAEKKKAAATPAPGAAAAKPAAAAGAQQKPGMTRTASKGPATTGTANRATAKGPGKQGAPAASAGQVGQVKEFTKEMAESMRARTVDFDPEEMADQPGVILLNPRKIQ